MAVPFVSLPQLRAPSTAGVSNALTRLGQTVSQGIETARSRNALRDFAATGDPSTLIASGDPRLASAGLAEQNRQRTAATAAQQRAEDVAFRRERFEEQKRRSREMTPFQRESLALQNRDLDRKLREAEAQGGFKDLKQRTDVESGLRKEFRRASKPFIESRDAYQRVLASEDTGAGDVSLIFNFMKTLDPGSTVREGEFATAEQTAGIPGRVRNLYNRAISGERLSPQQREQFRSQAAASFNRQQRQQEQRVGQYRGIVERLQLTPENVVVDLSAAEEQEGPTTSAPSDLPPPPPGFVVE